MVIVLFIIEAGGGLLISEDKAIILGMTPHDFISSWSLFCWFAERLLVER